MGILHMKIHKSWLIQCMEHRGVQDVFPDAPENMTVEEGIKELEKQAPREYWPECQNEDETGKCLGCQ